MDIVKKINIVMKNGKEHLFDIDSNDCDWNYDELMSILFEDEGKSFSKDKIWLRNGNMEITFIPYESISIIEEIKE